MSREEDLERTALLPRPAGDFWATAHLAIISGAGIIADGYDLQVINLVLAMLEMQYPEFEKPEAIAFVGSSTIAGVLIGMALFGALADAVGRRTVSLITSFLTTVSAGLSAFTVRQGQTHMVLYFGLCRFMLGLGMGGEYPVSAAMTIEANVGDKPLILTKLQLLAGNMMCYNIGSLMEALLVLGLLNTSLSLDVIWRVALAGGMVPSLIAFVLRLAMEEPEAATDDGIAFKRSYGRLWDDFCESVRPQIWNLCGCCLSWFVFNMVVYPLGTYNHTIIDDTVGTAGSQHHIIRQDAFYAAAMALLQIICIFLGTCVLMSLGTYRTQSLGFMGMVIVLLLLGSFTFTASKVIKIFLLLFMNPFVAAVGLTTYIAPAEGFAASVRSSCVGLAAASGKFGAMIGNAVFPLLADKAPLGSVIIVMGLFSSLGLVTTPMIADMTNHGKMKE